MAVVPASERVVEIVGSARGRVVIAAPYIKSPTLRTVMGAVSDAVDEVICITRWLPEDVACGVCDLGILEDVMSHEGGRLLVHPHLHAKYYRGGDRCLVGSANVTGRGFGWRTPGNVELMVELPAKFPGLGEWETALVGSAVGATEELRDRIGEEAERQELKGRRYCLPEVDGGLENQGGVADWVPECPVPERLWDVYNGGGGETMVSSARGGASRDIEALAPPRGLTKSLFEEYIAGIMRQMPFIEEIDRLARGGLTDSEAHRLLEEREKVTSAPGGDRTWRVVKDWLVYFFPETYRLETGQEVLLKGKRLGV